MCFSSFSDMGDDGEATTLASGVRSGMWVWLMLVCNTCGSGICQQAGTSTAQKGIRCLRKISSALCACPCSSPQLFSNSSISMWLARRRAGEQFLSNSPAQEPQEGQGQEERDTHRKGVNMSVVEHIHPSWAGSVTAFSWTRPAF